MKRLGAFDRRLWNVKRWLERGGLTALDEIEAIIDVALVASEEQSALLQCLAQLTFLVSDFGAELDATTEDTLFLRWDIESF